MMDGWIDLGLSNRFENTTDYPFAAAVSDVKMVYSSTKVVLCNYDSGVAVQLLR